MFLGDLEQQVCVLKHLALVVLADGLGNVRCLLADFSLIAVESVQNWKEVGQSLACAVGATQEHMLAIHYSLLDGLLLQRCQVLVIIRLQSFQQIRVEKRLLVVCLELVKAVRLEKVGESAAVRAQCIARSDHAGCSG